MKYFMLIWMCLNDQTIPLDQTCVEEQFKYTFNSLQECRAAAQDLYSTIATPDLHMTSFCVSKDLTII